MVSLILNGHLISTSLLPQHSQSLHLRWLQEWDCWCLDVGHKVQDSFHDSTYLYGKCHRTLKPSSAISELDPLSTKSLLSSQFLNVVRFFLPVI